MAPDIFGVIIAVHVIAIKSVFRPVSSHASTKQKLRKRGSFAGHCRTVGSRNGTCFVSPLWLQEVGEDR